MLLSISGFSEPSLGEASLDYGGVFQPGAHHSGHDYSKGYQGYPMV
ncbi:MAG: hypothetical protein QW506_00840 [Thermoproteota archaeon]